MNDGTCGGDSVSFRAGLADDGVDHPEERAVPIAVDAGGFATPADLAVCRRLHRRFGTTYYFASRWFPKEVRPRVDALYGFVRVPDEWVDNPTSDLDETAERLARYRQELWAGVNGQAPSEPALRAFCDLVRSGYFAATEGDLFLNAMEQDLTVTRYATYTDLEGYMRGSAASVGLMMAGILGAPDTLEVRQGAVALGNAMQLTNFIRDVAEDAQRGRIYLPMEDLERFSVSENDILEGRYSTEFKALIDFEISRARELYRQADEAIPLIPRPCRLAVALARTLYAQILDRVEAMDGNVFQGRARTSRVEKLTIAAKLAASHYLG